LRPANPTLVGGSDDEAAWRQPVTGKSASGQEAEPSGVTMSNSKFRSVDVRWHDITDPTDLNLHVGPGEVDTETVVTAFCGEVSGEIDRDVTRNDDGALVMVYAARIDGLRDGTGIAKIEANSADELLCLATVAGFLAREMATYSEIAEDRE
jgi:hypothetical protein